MAHSPRTGAARTRGESAPPVSLELLRHREDGVADRGPIGHHLVIGESQHGETAGFKPVLTHVVVLVLLLETACPTVQLDDQLLGKTHDVDDVRPYRLLSPDLVSELPHSKVRPVHRLRVGRVLSVASGKHSESRVNGHASTLPQWCKQFKTPDSPQPRSCSPTLSPECQQPFDRLRPLVAPRVLARNPQELGRFWMCRRGSARIPSFGRDGAQRQIPAFVGVRFDEIALLGQGK